MKRNVKRLLILFSICLNIGFITVSGVHILFQGGRGHSPENRRGFHRFEALVEEMDLTDAQEKRLLEEKNSMVDTVHGWRDEVRKARYDLLILSLQQSPETSDEVERRLDEIAALTRSHENSMVEHFRSMRDIAGEDNIRMVLERTREAYRKSLEREDG